MPCQQTGNCCTDLEGRRCPFLTDEMLCQLFVEHGSWDEACSDAGWVAEVGPIFARRWPGYHCGDWPQNIPTVRVGCCYG